MPESTEVDKLTLIKLALCKSFTENETKEIRNKVQPGTYHLDELVRLKGTLKVGTDIVAIQAQGADPWYLVHLALSKLNGVTINALVEEAISTKKTLSPEAYENMKKKFKVEVDEAVAKLKAETKEPRKGAAKFIGDIIHKVD